MDTEISGQANDSPALNSIIWRLLQGVTALCLAFCGFMLTQLVSRLETVEKTQAQFELRLSHEESSSVSIREHYLYITEHDKKHTELIMVISELQSQVASGIQTVAEGKAMPKELRDSINVLREEVRELQRQLSIIEAQTKYKDEYDLR